MLLLIRFLAKAFSLLNSEISPKQIAAGFAYGALIGLIPVGSLMPYALLFLGLVINFNLTAMFLAAAIFKLLSFGIDPVANHIGFQLLTKISSLKPFWTELYNMPVVPYTKFNNTIVMGSLAIGLFLFIPVFGLTVQGVKVYRTRLREKFLKFKIVQAIKASTFYKYYASYQDITGQ